MKGRLLPAFLSLFSFLLLTSANSEIPLPDKPYNHVVDLANIISDPVEADLIRYLLELEQKTTVQMVVLTISSLEGAALEDFSITVAHDRWKLGQQGRDNGLLFLVSLQDRKYRIETGYGLEGVIPDSLAGSLGRQYLIPYFRQGDFSTGILNASLAIINEIAADAGVTISGMPIVRRTSPSSSREIRPGFLFIMLLLFMLILYINMHRMSRRNHWGRGIGGGGGFSGGGGGFGSFGGGGFGSFGGGGGGGFGGGGASGGW